MKKFVAIFLVFISLVCVGCEPTNSSSSTSETKPSSKEPVVSLSSITQTSSTQEEPYLKAYKSLVEDYKNVINYRLSNDFSRSDTNVNISSELQTIINNNEDLRYRWGCMISELPLTTEPTKENLTYYGYILYDLNNDKIPELFWVKKDHTIAAIFTFYNNSIVFLDAYWSRSRCYITKSGQLYTTGSSGAADNDHDYMRLAEGKLSVTFGFYSESYDVQTPSGFEMKVRYFEYVDGLKEEITEEKYDLLLDSVPQENSTLWLSQPIKPIA